MCTFENSCVQSKQVDLAQQTLLCQGLYQRSLVKTLSAVEALLMATLGSFTVLHFIIKDYYR